MAGLEGEAPQLELVTPQSDIESLPSEPVTSQADIEASPSEPGSRFDIESSQPGEPISQWGRRGPVAVKSTAVVRPVRPWVRQPYYGAVFDGVTLGTVIAAAAVPTPPSFDLCWYWSNSSKTRSYWDFCQ